MQPWTCSLLVRVLFISLFLKEPEVTRFAFYCCADWILGVSQVNYRTVKVNNFDLIPAFLSIYRLFAGTNWRGANERCRGGGSQPSPHATCPHSLPPECLPRVGPRRHHHPYDAPAWEPAAQPYDDCLPLHTVIFPRLHQSGQPFSQSTNPKGEWCLKNTKDLRQDLNLLLLSFFSSFLSCLKHLSKPALESPYLSGNTQVVWLTRPVCMHGFPSLGAAEVCSTKTGTDYCTFPAVLSSRRACDTLFNSLHMLWICAKLASWLYLFLLPVVM